MYFGNYSCIFHRAVVCIRYTVVMDKSDLDFSALAANPYYAISFAPHAFTKHENLGSAEDWVAANTALIDDMGPKAWLDELLDVLSLSQDKYDGHDIINPMLVINISDSLSGEHQTIVTREQWSQINTKLIEEIGAGEWLWKLLETLDFSITK